PAPSSTDGFDVFVHDVMAAMTTLPSVSLYSSEPSTTCAWCAVGSVFLKAAFISDSATRSCGRDGPASEGTTVPRSSSSVSLKTGSGEDAWRNRPCSLQ